MIIMLNVYIHVHIEMCLYMVCCLTSKTCLYVYANTTLYFHSTHET